LLPQVPQLFASLVVLISQPLAGLPSQSMKPVLQDLMAQFDALHVGVAFAKLHAVPQPPQLFTSLVVLISQPSEAVLLQSAYPVAHDAMAHADDVHVAVAFAKLHTWPQLPQLFTSFVVLAQ
jgi:hypothetical protein